MNTYDVDWPEFNIVNQSYLHLGIPPVVGHHYRQRYMKFWNNDINEIMKKESEAISKYHYGNFYTPPPRRISPAMPTGHISMYPIQVDVEHPAKDPIRILNEELKTKKLGHVSYATTESIKMQEIEEEEILKLELTTFLFIAFIILAILILILGIIIYIYKKKKVEHKYDNAHVFDALTDDKRSKFNDTDDSYILDILRKTSNGTYEQVKVNHSPINGFKLTRQTSSSTVDAHTKVSDWISSEITHYNPKVQVKHNGDSKSNSNSNSNSFQTIKKGEKVSVAIDATPQARSNSILRQEPIEVTKAKSSFDYGNGKIICQEVEVDASMIEEMPLRNFPDIQECGSSCSSIANCEECQINHAHSYSDPIEVIYAPPKLYQESVTSFMGPHDINVTCREGSAEKIPLSREESLKSMQKMNFPKVLPNFPEDIYFNNNAMKRRSLPPQYYMVHNTNSLSRDSMKVPPAPPPRLSSTLGRKPSKRDRSSNFMTSPIMVAEEPPSVEEPEITQSCLKVGPLIPKENIYMSMKKRTMSRENSNSSSSYDGNQEVPPPESLQENSLDKNDCQDPIYTEISKSTHTQMPQNPDEYSITTNAAKKIMARQDSNSQSSSSSSGSSSQTESSISSSVTSSDDTSSSTGTIKKI